MVTKYAKFIKEARGKKGLSQSDLALKLGISRPSYIAIEQGKRELTLGEFEKLSSILNVSFEEVENGESPNYEKYKQMILAFLRLNKNITKTKLAKLVYLSDFAWFYNHLQSMSGMQYRKIKYGPVPDAFFRALDELEEEGKIGIDRKNTDGKEMIIISESDSNKKQKLENISGDETILIKNIYKKWKDKKTAEIVNFTHNQLPYLMADDEEIVSYALITQEDPHEVY
ncbi:MAG: helix-turn-helix domain-containing protein [Patescibacteria group bacterium]